MHKKKKIAIFMPDFPVGGTEKALLDFLDALDREKVEPTVFLGNDAGAWVPQLRQKAQVTVLPVQRFGSVILEQAKRLQFFGAARSIAYRILCRWYFKRNDRKSREYLLRSMPRIKGCYDCAVVYQLLSDECITRCLHCIRAKTKAAWVHSMEIPKPERAAGYEGFDKIFCVSREAQSVFSAAYPRLASKTDVFRNLMNADRIIQLADGEAAEIQHGEGNVLVTVGRLSSEKGQDLIPRTARLLLDAGIPVKWYLVGDGNLRPEIEAEIKKEQVEGTVILLGSRNNPYPYIKACDVYVQTSHSEGWGLSVSEAKVLCKPIVTTEARVMREQIEDGINGILVDDTPEELAAAIGRLIQNPEQQKAFSRQLQKDSITVNQDIQKFYDFLQTACAGRKG